MQASVGSDEAARSGRGCTCTFVGTKVQPPQSALEFKKRQTRRLFCWSLNTERVDTCTFEGTKVRMSRPISSESKFRAIAHPTRRGIIDLLVRDEQTPNEMASHFKHSRPVF